MLVGLKLEISYSEIAPFNLRIGPDVKVTQARDFKDLFCFCDIEAMNWKHWSFLSMQCRWQ